MATVTKKLSLDVSRKNLLPNIIAKQFDTDSRFLTVRLLDDGRDLKVEAGSTVIISFRRADGQAKSFSGNANEDGTVTVPLANWALELDDIVECDISVYQGEAKLSTTTFRLEVQPAANGSGDISEDEDYDILKQLIVEVQTATEGANSAASEAEKWGHVTATAEGLAPGSAPTVALEETEDGKKLKFGIPKGEKGEKGDPGTISGVKLNGTPLVPDEAGMVDVNCIKKILVQATAGNVSWLEIAKLAPSVVVRSEPCATTFLVCGGDDYGSNARELFAVNFGTRNGFYMVATQISTYSHISTVKFGWWIDEDGYYHIGAQRTGYSSVMQFYQLLEAPKHLIEVFEAPKYYEEQPIGWTPVKTDRAYSENNKPVLENLEGILPVKKGGTGYSEPAPSKASPSTRDIQGPFDAQNFRNDLGKLINEDFIAICRNLETNEYATDGSVTLRLGKWNTDAYICISCQTPRVDVGGGAENGIYWHKQLAFKDDLSATQLALASLYESRSVSPASADMPMSSPSIDGELSALDQIMLPVYASLCLNPDSGKTIADVPEHLRVQVSAMVEKTIAEYKEAEEKYKAEMEEREAEEFRKADAASSEPANAQPADAEKIEKEES